MGAVLNERQRSLVLFWVEVVLLAELILFAGNRFLPQLFQLIAALFLSGFLMRLANRYPGQKEPLMLDGSAAFIALLFSAVSVMVGGGSLRFLLITVSSLIIVPHIVYIFANPQAFPTEALMRRVMITKGDITQQKVDAIVNAANTTLMGGGGVDGAIHRAAGPKLLAECVTLGGCPTGQAKITKAYNLAATYVIHTPGPRWQGGNHGEDEMLAACYRNALRVAAERGVKTIAFPSISTGAYNFPLVRASRIALKTVLAILAEQPSFELVNFVCFDDDDCREYHFAAQELGVKLRVEPLAAAS